MAFIQELCRLRLFCNVILYIVLPLCLVSWPMAMVFRYLRNQQKAKYDSAQGFLMLLIIVPYIGFWGAVAIDHYKLITWYAQKNKTVLSSFPGATRALKKMQKDVSLLLWGKIDFKRPYRLLWLLISNPLPQAGFIYFVFFNRPNRFEDQLKRYRNTVPKEINMGKVYKKAVKEAKGNGYGFTFLGYDFKYRKPAIITDEERLRHVQILGGTGSGKTSSLILPMIQQDMERGRGIVFVDAKGDITTARTMYKMAVDAGRKEDFLMFSMSNPEKSNTYNPLALGNATQLKDKIIGAMDFTKPHYKRECESGLQILFDELLERRGIVTLGALCEALNKPTDEFPKFLAFYDEHKKNILGIQAEISLLMNTRFSPSFQFRGDQSA